MATENDRAAAKTGSTLNILAGIWTILSPYILNFANASKTAQQNNIIIGVLVLLLALVGASNARVSWSRWANIVLGAWLFLSPFLLKFSGLSNALWNNIILGILVIAFAGWSANNIVRYHRPQPM